jgi:hypothetical protein
MTALDVFALIVLLVMAAVFVGGAILLAMWPGRVARERGHPRADAVAVCGWWGLVTMGILLPVAWIWAYSWPPGGLAKSSDEEVDAEQEGGRS